MPKKLADKQAEAQVRQAEREARSPQEQLARLDKMFGPGQGAKKERTKLARRIGLAIVNSPPKMLDGEVPADLKPIMNVKKSKKKS